MTEDERALWGPLIAERREQLDLTQEQLAAAADVAPKTVYNIEAGGRTPQPKTLRKVQMALGLSSDIEVARERVSEARRTLEFRREDRERTARFSAEADAVLRDASQIDRALVGLVKMQTAALGNDVQAMKEHLHEMFLPTFWILTEMSYRARAGEPAVSPWPDGVAPAPRPRGLDVDIVTEVVEQDWDEPHGAAGPVAARSTVDPKHRRRGPREQRPD